MNGSIQQRNNPRKIFNCLAHFRTLDGGQDGLERLCVTKDFSRGGLYFVAFDHAVPLNTELLLNFPYLEDSGEVQRQCLVQVVRTHALFPGRYGVGATFISSNVPREERNVLTAVPSMAVPHQAAVAAAYRLNLYA